jgi:hypothetical protein
MNRFPLAFDMQTRSACHIQNWLQSRMISAAPARESRKAHRATPPPPALALSSSHSRIRSGQSFIALCPNILKFKSLRTAHLLRPTNTRITHCGDQERIAFARMAPATKILSHGSRLVDKLKTYWFGKKIGSYHRLETPSESIDYVFD